LQLWHAPTGLKLRTLSAPAEHLINAWAFSPDGERIVSASFDHTLRVWGARRGKELATLRGHSNDVRACAFTPNARQIASASDDGTLKVWDAETGENLNSLHQNGGRVVPCAVSPDGERIGIGTRDPSSVRGNRGGPSVRISHGSSD
jgi:WD40 repeat protein